MTRDRARRDRRGRRAPSNVQSSTALRNTARAQMRVESSVGSGAASGDPSSGISLQLRITASQPASFDPRVISMQLASVGSQEFCLEQRVEDDPVEPLGLFVSGDAMVCAGAVQSVAIDRVLHALTRAQDTEALVMTALRLLGHLDCKMQPGSRPTMLDKVEGRVVGVARSDEKVRASVGRFLRGGKQQVGPSRSTPSRQIVG